MPSSTILVVIESDKPQQQALERAAQLAQHSGAQIHAFCCNYHGDFSQFASRKDAKHQTLIQTRQQLEALAQPLREQGLNVTTEAYWNEDWQQSVIHASSRCGADLIIKSAHGSDTSAKLSRDNAYCLLRNANCPVLICRDDQPWQQTRILAAVTLDNDDVEHDLLNNVIIGEAQKLARITGFELHIVSALEKSPKILSIFKMLDQDHEETEAQELVSQRFGVPIEHIHLHPGKPRAVIEATASDIGAELLIIGTVARKGLRAALVGNTAEKLMNEMAIDVMTVS